MRAGRTVLIGAVLTALLTAVGACQSSPLPSTRPATSIVPSPSPTAPVTLASVTPSPTPTRTRPTPRPSPTSSPARPRARQLPTKPKPARCDVPAGVTSQQVVVVDAYGSGATIRACERSGSRYTLVLGPYDGHVGRGGVRSAKREGDLSTPAGTFALRNGFGVYGNPGLGVGSWLRVDERDVWVDDSGSALYNTRQRTPVDGRWDSAEQLAQSPAYNYAQVIGYNEARTPGAGSAIFLHVDQGRATVGCVSLPTRALLAVMRWERSGVVIAITG